VGQGRKRLIEKRWCRRKYIEHYSIWHLFGVVWWLLTVTLSVSLSVCQSLFLLVTRPSSSVSTSPFLSSSSSHPPSHSYKAHAGILSPSPSILYAHTCNTHALTPTAQAKLPVSKPRSNHTKLLSPPSQRPDSRLHIASHRRFAVSLPLPSQLCQLCLALSVLSVMSLRRTHQHPSHIYSTYVYTVHTRTQSCIHTAKYIYFFCIV
jgi:hypothetical protein